VLCDGERSKARVYGRTLAGIAGSNPTGSMDGCPLCVSSRGLCDGPITRPEESPTDCGASLCVISEPLE
jgi:hypothetical protein